MNQSLDIRVSCGYLGNSHGHADVALFELALLLAVDTVADAVDNNVLVSNHVLELLRVGEVIQLHVGLVAEIGSWLDFLELVVPDSRGATVRINNLRAYSSERRTHRHAENARGTEDRGIDSRQAVATALVVDVQALQLVVPLRSLQHESLLDGEVLSCA